MIRLTAMHDRSMLIPKSLKHPHTEQFFGINRKFVIKKGHWETTFLEARSLESLISAKRNNALSTLKISIETRYQRESLWHLELKSHSKVQANKNTV